MRIFFTLVAMLLSTTDAFSQAIVSDLSQNRVSITANFDGSQIFVFGAVKSNILPDVNASPLDVVIVVAGPIGPVEVRKKVYKYGIWVNSEGVVVDHAPSFYSIAATQPIDEILSAEEQDKYDIGLDYAVEIVDGASEEYAEAVIRIRQDMGIFATELTEVRLSEETLFTTDISLPSNLIEGDYTASIYLVRDNKVVAESHSDIAVRKTGLERWLYVLAHEKPLIYGLFSLAVALFSGWLASEIFRRLKR